MHELAYVLKITDLSLRAAEEKGLSSVKEISVEVGAMTGALDHYLKLYFKKASKGTILEGAVLNITNVPVLAECECGNIYHPEKETGYTCPVCKSRKGRITRGRDICVVSVSGVTG